MTEASPPDISQPPTDAHETRGGRGVRFERDGGVGRIVLDRPEVANAFDLPAVDAMRAAVTAAADDEVRVVTLTGEGPRFCAGGDVSSFVAAPEPTEYLRQLAGGLEAELRRLSELPKPVVAGVHGAVAGAGLALVLNSDVVVAGSGTRFAFAYASIGLTPDCGVSYLLPRAIGQQRALAFALTGKVLTAEEACDWGLVAEVVDDDRVPRRVGEIARQMADGPASALWEATRLMRDSWNVDRAASALDETETMARMVSTPDARRLIESFLRRDT